MAYHEEHQNDSGEGDEEREFLEEDGPLMEMIL